MENQTIVMKKFSKDGATCFVAGGSEDLILTFIEHRLHIKGISSSDLCNPSDDEMERPRFFLGDYGYQEQTSLYEEVAEYKNKEEEEKSWAWTVWVETPFVLETPISCGNGMGNLAVHLWKGGFNDYLDLASFSDEPEKEVSDECTLVRALSTYLELEEGESTQFEWMQGRQLVDVVIKRIDYYTYQALEIKKKNRSTFWAKFYSKNEPHTV